VKTFRAKLSNFRELRKKGGEQSHWGKSGSGPKRLHQNNDRTIG